MNFYRATYDLLRETDEERLRRLAAMGDPEARMQVRRLDLRSGKRLTFEDWERATSRWSSIDQSLTEGFYQYSSVHLGVGFGVHNLLSVNARWAADSAENVYTGRGAPSSFLQAWLLPESGEVERVEIATVLKDLDRGSRRWNLGRHEPPWFRGESVPPWKFYQFLDQLFPLPLEGKERR